MVFKLFYIKKVVSQWIKDTISSIVNPIRSYIIVPGFAIEFSIQGYFNTYLISLTKSQCNVTVIKTHNSILKLLCLRCLWNVKLTFGYHFNDKIDMPFKQLNK